MAPVQITVRGSHTHRMAPEQATVYADIVADGPEPQPVFDAVAAALADVTASLQSRLNAAHGPVRTYVAEQVRRGAHRPFNTEGEQLPLVHTAAVSVSATFTDFDDLAAWVGWSAGVPRLGINYIDWELTDATRLAAERATRQAAVRDAQRRAQDYADALDLGPVEIRAIGEPGAHEQPMYRATMARAMSDTGGPPQISLRPDEVQISDQVQATFSAGGGD